LNGWSGFMVDLSVPGEVTVPGKNGDVTLQPAGADYFQTYRIPILAGRGITLSDGATAPKVVVINQTLARKYFGEENPIGRRLRGSSVGDREIVGVVRDVIHQNLQAPVSATAYVPFAQNIWGAAAFTVRTVGEPSAMVPAIRNAVREVDRNVPLADVRTQDEVFERRLISGERFFAHVSVFLGLVALGLACVGLYGLMSYSVLRRTNEIGIRLALGALPRWITTMIWRESLALVGFGVIVGIVAAGFATRLIAKLLYGLSPVDPIAYGLAALLLVAVASLACLLPARRAATVDPMVALRAE
jgi:predicted permease